MRSRSWSPPVAGLAIVCAFLFAPAARAAAQETINSASVGGRVIDPQGSVVPGALVSARQIQTNVLAETTTDKDGRFTLKGVPSSAKYTLEVRTKDYAPVSQEIAPPRTGATAAATLLWRQIERELLMRAVSVPTSNIRNVDLVSERVGNYQYHPQWGALLDQLWVK